MLVVFVMIFYIYLILYISFIFNQQILHKNVIFIISFKKIITYFAKRITYFKGITEDLEKRIF